MAPVLYYSPLSGPSRSALLTAKAIGVELDEQVVNLAALDQLKPEYLKINPQHTVPTLKDGNFAIWDSHAINAYLVGKYAADDALYPKDLEKRAVIDQRLHFDSSILFPRISAIVASILRGGATSVAKDKADLVIQGYTLLESIIDGKKYAAGDELSIADFNIATTLTTSNVLVPIASNTFPNISAYLSRIAQLPYYQEANQKGADMFAGFIRSKLA